MAKRIGWIDVCKGIGMVLVAAGHNSGLQRELPNLMQAVYLFHVPLFFFLSGLTLKAEAGVAAIGQRVGRILLPYLVMTLLTAPFAWREFRQLALSDFALGTLYGSGFTIGNVPLWFLPCLAVALVIAIVVLRVTEGRWAQSAMRWGGVAGLLVAGSGLMSLMLSGQHRVIGWGSFAHSGGFWSVDVALVAAAYVVVGRLFFDWLRDHEYASPAEQASLHPSWLLGITLVGLGGVALAYCLGVRTDLNVRHYSPLLGATLAAFAGVAAIVAWSMWIDSMSARSASWAKSVKWLATLFEWVGQSSLVVLGLHSYAMHTLGKAATRVLGDEAWVWAVVLALAVALCVVVDRWVIRRVVWLNKLFYPKF